MSNTIQVSEDGITLEDAVNQVDGDDTTIIVGKGTHVVKVYKDNGEDTNTLHIPFTMRIVGEQGVPREEIVIMGGIYFQADNCHLEGLTVSEAKEHGVRGISYFTMDNVLVNNCGYCGIRVYGADANCTNVEVIECGWSGVTAVGGATITLIGDRTSVHGNCTKDLTGDDYGLQASQGSTIQLVFPLTKEQVSRNNGGGRNWDNGVVVIPAGETKTTDVRTPVHVVNRRGTPNTPDDLLEWFGPDDSDDSEESSRTKEGFSILHVADPAPVAAESRSTKPRPMVGGVKKKNKTKDIIHWNQTKDSIDRQCRIVFTDKTTNENNIKDILGWVQEVINENPNNNQDVNYEENVTFLYTTFKTAYEAENFVLCQKMLVFEILFHTTFETAPMKLLMFTKAIDYSNVDLIRFLCKTITLDSLTDKQKHSIVQHTIDQYGTVKLSYDKGTEGREYRNTSIILLFILKTFKVTLIELKGTKVVKHFQGTIVDNILKFCPDPIYLQLQEAYWKKEIAKELVDITSPFYNLTSRLYEHNLSTFNRLRKKGNPNKPRGKPRGKQRGKLKKSKLPRLRIL
jgi:hypothetical protein